MLLILIHGNPPSFPFHSSRLPWTNGLRNRAEGFLKFKEDTDNLEAFRVAHGSHIIEIKVGWDKEWIKKQKVTHYTTMMIASEWPLK